MPERIFMKFGMYIMALEPISLAYFVSPPIATHILCDCEAVAQIRFRHLGQFFMEPSDYYDAPID
jgi:hypothetical protein